MNKISLTWLQTLIAGAYLFALFALILHMSRSVVKEWHQTGLPEVLKVRVADTYGSPSTVPRALPAGAEDSLVAEIHNRLTLDAKEAEEEERRLGASLDFAEKEYQTKLDRLRGEKPSWFSPSDRMKWVARDEVAKVMEPYAEKLDRLQVAHARQLHYLAATRERAAALAAKNADLYKAATVRATEALNDTRTLAADIREGITRPGIGATLPGVGNQLRTQLDERPWGHWLQLGLHISGMILVGGLICRVLFRILVLARCLNPVTYRPHAA